MLAIVMNRALICSDMWLVGAEPLAPPRPDTALPHVFIKYSNSPLSITLL